MPTKIKIKIDRDILERSSECGLSNKKMPATTNCAFALAVRDILPHARVGGSHIYTGPMGILFPITPEMTKFITKFDTSTPEERRKMEEREFELEIPDEVLALIGDGEIEEVKKIISQSKTLELVP